MSDLGKGSPSEFAQQRQSPIGERIVPETQTTEWHRAHHVNLHKALDELFADFITHNPHLHNYTMQPIMALLKWSNEQQQNPTELP